VQLILRYQCQGIDQSIEYPGSFSPITTIHTVTQLFLKFARSRTTDVPKDIVLVSFRTNGRTYGVSSPNSDKTLHDLGIEDKSELNFEPSVLFRPILSRLILHIHNTSEKIEYEWDETTTTLGTLVDDIMEILSLKPIERERIHLHRLRRIELDHKSDANKLLSELGVNDFAAISVEIDTLRVSSNSNQNENVRIECRYFDGKLIFDARVTDTIDGLRDYIKNRFKDRLVIDFQLYNAFDEKIDLNGKSKMLQEFGIKPGQTIRADIRFGVGQHPPKLIDKRIEMLPLSASSLNTEQQNDEINVHCEFSNCDLVTIKASVKDTVSQLTKKIAALKKDRTMSRFLLWSGSITIDTKQPHRYLADFGIKPGSKVYATELDDTPTYSSIVSRRSTASSTLTRQYQDDPKPIGLDNLGNTCFMNSALQCLAYVKPLTEFFLNGFTQAHSDDDDDWNPFDTCGNVTGAYAELIWNLWRGDRKDSYYRSFKPDRIKETIGCLAPRFATCDQQDAQEFLTFLLDALHDEFKEKNKPDTNTIIKQLFFGQMQSTITCLKCKNIEKTINPFCFLSLPLSRQERLFLINFISSDGQQDTVVLNMPTCGRVEHLVSAFTDARHSYSLFYRIYAMTTNTNEHLPFDIPLSELPDQEVTFIEQEEDVDRNRRRPDRCETQPYKLTLEECLQEFVSLEVLEDLWLCPRDDCKERTKASKQLQLTSLPPVLIIQLKRFSHKNGLRHKLDTLVEYPLNGLSLSGQLPSSEQTIYDLIAVSNHVGSIYGGHYTAYARQDVNTEKWYKFDDSYVSTVYYSNDLVSRDAYLLFYIKRNNQKQSSQNKSTTS
jgi:ubiquitin C-terminal hydrolase